MRRRIFATLILLLLAAASLAAARRSETQPVRLTAGRFIAESPKFGQFLLHDIYLVLENPAHPLKLRLQQFAKQSAGCTVTLDIEPDTSDEADPNTLSLHGLLTMSDDGIGELKVIPQKGDRFTPTLIGFVTVTAQHLINLKSFRNQRVRITLRVHDTT